MDTQLDNKNGLKINVRDGKRGKYYMELTIQDIMNLLNANARQSQIYNVKNIDLKKKLESIRDSVQDKNDMQYKLDMDSNKLFNRAEKIYTGMIRDVNTENKFKHLLEEPYASLVNYSLKSPRKVNKAKKAKKAKAKKAKKAAKNSPKKVKTKSAKVRTTLNKRRQSKRQSKKQRNNKTRKIDWTNIPGIKTINKYKQHDLPGLLA
tara:strand:- start:3 stop:620 length:618 start_codon:yes stop_codon:yes gene_type:complete